MTKAVRTLDVGKKIYYRPEPCLLYSMDSLGDAYNGLEQKEKSYKSYDKALENKADNDHVLNNYSYFLSLAEGRISIKQLKMSE